MVAPLAFRKEHQAALYTGTVRAPEHLIRPICFLSEKGQKGQKGLKGRDERENPKPKNAKTPRPFDRGVLEFSLTFFP